MKLLLIIGALLISAAPVQAFETYEELDKACNASEETYNTCTKAGIFVGTFSWVSLLCELEAKGSLTRKETVMTWTEFVQKNGMTPLSDNALEMSLKNYPECSIKPFR